MPLFKDQNKRSLHNWRNIFDILVHCVGRSKSSFFYRLTFLSFCVLLSQVLHLLRILLHDLKTVLMGVCVTDMAILGRVPALSAY